MKTKINSTFYFIIIVCMSVFFSGCEKWLDVDPLSEVKEEKMFETEDGFKNALRGIYIKMHQPDLYGSNLTMGFVDVLAQTYDRVWNPDAMYSMAVDYKYDKEKVRNTINKIWSNGYFCIANCNKLLDNLNTRPNILILQDYDIIKGEALALRAYLHFDLLRLFAPAAVKGLTQPAIPYYESVRKEPYPQLETGKVIEKVLVDLGKARELLKVSDPIGPVINQEVTFAEAQKDIQKTFLLNRNRHMNYWAVTFMLARVHAYAGNKEQALSYASEVIKSEWFTWSGIGMMSDPVAKKEIVFGLDHYTLKEKMERHFEAASTKNAFECYIMPDKLKTFFEDNLTDHRYIYQFDRYVEDSPKDYLLKYRDSKLIPLLRLSEMYLIAAECEKNTEKAWEYLNHVRTKRGLGELSTTEGHKLSERIYHEYRKEYLGEGQMFFYLKRLNVEQIEFSPEPGSDKVYVLPVPDKEFEFGNMIN